MNTQAVTPETETEATVADAPVDINLVKLAQEQRKFKKKVCDAEDALIEADDVIETAKEAVRKADGLTIVQEFVKDWAKAEKTRERMLEQRDNYQQMLDGVTNQMKEAL